LAQSLSPLSPNPASVLQMFPYSVTCLGRWRISWNFCMF
jgi:hypothetical protein